MVPWYHGTMVQWYHGTIAWYHGTMVPWYHGTMVPWYHGTMVPWYHGTMVPTMVPWYHGTMVSWYHGTMVPWQPCPLEAGGRLVGGLGGGAPQYSGGLGGRAPQGAHEFSIRWLGRPQELRFRKRACATTLTNALLLQPKNGTAANEEFRELFLTYILG